MVIIPLFISVFFVVIILLPGLLVKSFNYLSSCSCSAPVYSIYYAFKWGDKLTYALGLLMYGLFMVGIGFTRLGINLLFDFVLDSLCYIFNHPFTYNLESAFMMSSTDNDWDARKYPKCRPYFGKRGLAFESFVRDLSAALAEEGDEDSSLEETMFGTDTGGDAAGAPAGGTAAQQRRRTARLRKLYAILYRHVPEPRLREMLYANARNDGRAAYQLLVANCRQAVDDLELLQLDADFDTATILNSVGYSMDSITLFARHLNGMNALRPVGSRKTDDQLTIKFLSCVDSSINATLGHEAMKELRASGGARQFVTGAGGRDLQACVTFFDDLWRSHFRSGDIRARPKQRTSVDDRTARADAQLAGDVEEEEEGAMLARAGTRRTPISREQMQREPNCWRCRGFGHVAEDCPSSEGFRAISDAVALLNALLPSARRNGKGKGKGGGRGYGGRGFGGRGGGRSQRRIGGTNVALDDGFFIDDDGSIYTEDGVYIGSVEAQATEESPPADPAPRNDEAADVASDVDDEYVGDMYVLEDVTTNENRIVCHNHECGGTCFARVCDVCHSLAHCKIVECLTCGYWYCTGTSIRPQSCERYQGCTSDTTSDTNKEDYIMYNDFMDLGYTHAEALEGAFYMSQREIVPPGATLDPSGLYYNYMDRLWRSAEMITAQFPLRDLAAEPLRDLAAELECLQAAVPSYDSAVQDREVTQQLDLLRTVIEQRLVDDATLEDHMTELDQRYPPYGDDSDECVECDDDAASTSSASSGLSSHVPTSVYVDTCSRRRCFHTRSLPRGDCFHVDSPHRRPRMDPEWLSAMESAPCFDFVGPLPQGGSALRSACSSFWRMCMLVMATVTAFARGSASTVMTVLKFSLTLTIGMLIGLHRGIDLGVGLGAAVILANAQGAEGAVTTVMPLYSNDTALCLGSFNSNASDWIVDCGATKHCTPSSADLFEIDQTNPRLQVRVGNGKLLRVSAVGKARLKVPTMVQTKRKNKTSIREGSETMVLSNVLVVPEIKYRLFSCEWGWRHDDIATYLNDQRCLRLPSGAQVPFKNNTPDRHYRITMAHATDDLTADDSDLIHASFGHFSLARIRHLNMKGYRHDPDSCPACLANRRKKSVPKTSTSGRVFTHFGQCVCSDICGEFSESPQGFTHACNFYDKYSHVAAVYFMKSKHAEEIRRCFETFISDHREYLKDGKVDEWVCDDGQPFHSNDLDQMCVELSTRRAFAVPHVKEKHGSAERLWGILLGPSRKMHWHAGNDTGKECLWPFLLTQTCLLHNALPTASLSPPTAPWERATGKQPDLSIFKGKVMFSDCWVNTANPQDKPVNKLSSNNIKAVYLGYDARRRADFVYIPELKRVTTCFHVTHCPRQFSLLGESATIRRYKERADLPTSTGTNGDTGRTWPPRVVAIDPVWPQANATQPRPEQPPPIASPSPAPAPADAQAIDAFGSHGDAFLVNHSAGAFVASMNAVEPVRIPTSYWDAISDPVYGKQWKEACDSEYRGKAFENRSWTHVHKPGNRTLTKSKWVYKVDYNLDGSIKRFKARIVACGYSQLEGLDWKEKYASTLSADSMRGFLFDANQSNCEMCEADVVKAFTHATLEEEIYMQPPAGYAPKDGKVCLLRKGVEGLKQGANGFMKLNATVIEAEGFERSMLDPNIYTRTRDNVTLKVGVYVDNLLCSFPRGAQGREQCAAFFAAYGKKINLEVRGPPKAFMGIEIQYDINKGTLFLSQASYLEKAFEKFCDKSTKLYTTPVQTSACDAFMKLRAAETDEERMAMSDKAYLSLMGSILWATIMTRPDCAYHASFLCQFMSDPTIECWHAAIALLSYLYATRKLGLLYRRKDKITLSLYSDSSYGSVTKPMYGFVVFANGTPLSWTAKKQKIVPQSSCEAETAALCAGCKSLMFIRNFLAELGSTVTVTLPMDTYTDNDAARLTAINPGTTARTKHYETWMQYVRELHLKLLIAVNWVPTKEQIADVFTKAMDKTTFLYLRSQLMSGEHTL